MVNRKSTSDSPSDEEKLKDDEVDNICKFAEGDDHPGTTHPKPVDYRHWPIQIIKTERTIFELHRSHKDKVLRLDPDFQRDSVWIEARKIRLIESVLARIPLPVFYLSEEDEDETIVIDGQQRLRSLFDFLDGQFALKDLSLAPEFNGQRIGDLDPKSRRRFENTPLTCFIVQPGTKPQIKFEIFERLNQGGVVLNAQEIRNCMFRGPGLSMIRDLARAEGPGSFRAVAGKHRKFSRMTADEFILRAIAFLDLGVSQYPGELRTFLNDELKQLNQSQADHREKLKARFSNALSRVFTTFGQHAFQRYDDMKKNWVGHINGPVLEVMIVGFDEYFPAGAPYGQSIAMKVEEQFKKLCALQNFRDSITFATQPTDTVKYRIDMWRRELADVAQHSH